MRIGTSDGAARSPFTLIQWKPPQNHMALMITRRHTSINLMNMTNAKTYFFECHMEWEGKHVSLGTHYSLCNYALSIIMQSGQIMIRSFQYNRFVAIIACVFKAHTPPPPRLWLNDKLRTPK